jgi:hypothetical protein
MHLPSMKVVALKKVPLHNTARYDSSAQDTSSHHKWAYEDDTSADVTRVYRIALILS